MVVKYGPHCSEVGTANVQASFSSGETVQSLKDILNNSYVWLNPTNVDLKQIANYVEN